MNNSLYRVLVIIYSFILSVIFGIIMISPFGDKVLMSMGIDFVSSTLYQSNK